MSDFIMLTGTDDGFILPKRLITFIRRLSPTETRIFIEPDTVHFEAGSFGSVDVDIPIETIWGLLNE